MAIDGDMESTNRRKSGRTVRKPEIFGEENQESSMISNITTKRKRTSTTNGQRDSENHDQDRDEDELDEPTSDDDSNGSEPDEEELKEQRKRKRTKSMVAKPVAKRTKTTNGPSTTLAIRSAGRSKPMTKTAKTQKARSRPSQASATGLYAEVFGHSNTEIEAAASWREALQEDNTVGVRDLINFVLQCIGCDTRIEASDIEDIDHVPERLGEVLEEYASQKTSDYPLTSKAKQHTGMKDVVVAFFNAIIHALHSSGMMYDEPAIYDNIHVWIATMSGAGYRPFRHTATVMSLSMTTALCEVAKELENSMVTSKDQIDAEKKKKTTNKARVKKLQEEKQREEARLEHVNGLLRDAFDTVYVHRYRDVDEKIRVECVAALGTWISLYRAMFLEGQYLRYLGWVLSDPNAPTRLEVVRALKNLFKDRKNIGALRAFTDRFRDRMVEMGSRDTDTSVRAEAIELLDRLRNAELLKAEDIDTIGQLIFDNEPRVRKAVAKFFVSNIQDLYDASIEEFDQDQYITALPPSKEVDDFLDPCQSWIKFKCLAQLLVSHDKDNESRKSGERHQDVYGAEDTESRYMLATQSIYPFMPELHEWKALAGYLLFDHSSITAEADNADVNLAVRGAFKLDSGEDTVLLDVLQLSVKLSLQQILDAQNEKKGKKSSSSKDEIRKQQEIAAQHLMLIIPQLLNKFGGAPEAAASILRLEQLLNADLINELQSGEGTYADILEDINKQFNSHNDKKVLAEASKAFRTARTYETSQDAVDAKVTEIWSDSKESLSTLLQGKNIPARGTMDRNVLREVGDIMGRLAQLAVVSDCTEVIESRISGTGTKKTKVRGTSQTTLLEILLQLTQRGVADDDTTEHFATLEDRICGSVLTILSLYFRWTVVGLKKAITERSTKSLTTGVLTNLVMHRTSFIEAVQAVISTRQPLDHTRVHATLTLLDIFTLFATVRHMKPTKGELDEDIQSNLNTLVTNVPSDIVTLVMETHEKMEKRLAKKNKKRIELLLDAKKMSKHRGGTVSSEVDEVDDVEKPPEDSDDEVNNESGSDSEDSDSEEVEPGKQGREAKKQASLIAEQALCELTSKIVLATIASVIGTDGKIKTRLQLNRTRLGKSYGQIIAYLDEKKVKKPKGKADQAEKTPLKTKTPVKKAKEQISESMVIEDDDIEDEEMEQRVEEGDEEDLRARGLDDDVVEDEEEEEEPRGEEGRDEVEDEIMGD